MVVAGALRRAGRLGGFGGLSKCIRYSSSIHGMDNDYMVEVRNYTIKPNMFGEFMSLVNSTRDLRTSLLPVIGMYKSDIGSEELNSFLHLYKYKDFDHRDDVRRKASESHEWAQEYLPRAKDMMTAQKNAIYKPASNIMMSASAPSGGAMTRGAMLEIREYQFQAGYDTIPSVLEAFQKAIPEKIQAASDRGLEGHELVFFGYTDVGILNNLVEIWKYPTAQTCILARQASRSVDSWRECIKTITPRVQHFRSGYWYDC